MAALGQQSTCGVCTQPAVSLCTQCRLRLCQQCENNLAPDSSHGNAEEPLSNGESQHSNGCCSHEHSIRPLSETSSCDTADTVDKIASLVCPNHNGLSLEFYCTNCETAICETCTTGEHSSHEAVALTDAIMEHKQTLNVWLDKTKGQISEITRAIGVVEEVAQSLTDNYHQAQVAATQVYILTLIDHT